MQPFALAVAPENCYPFHDLQTRKTGFSSCYYYPLQIAPYFFQLFAVTVVCMSCLTLAIQFDRLFLPTAFRMLTLRPLRFSPEGFTTCQAFTPCHASGLSGCTCGAVCLPCLPSIVYRRPPYGVHCYFDGCMACRHTATVSPVLNGCLSRNLALFVSCPHS